MKVHRVTVLVLDFDELGADGVKAEMEAVRYPNRCMSPEVKHVETIDIGEWKDDHPLNYRGEKRDAEYRRLFPTGKEQP
ncbi:MAG: hypothetical protein CMK74_14665 [Pseudomonadales bacterium]|nr:hypothetical protein [Pseudomonadales bacterium]